MKVNGRVGLIARFKPLHNGAYKMLESVCSQADEVVIGIGSSNKYNERNPFTADESEDMINAALNQKFSNYKIIHIPDFAHIPEFSNGQQWKKYVVNKFGTLDYFISSNPFVRELLKDTYTLVYPFSLIPIGGHIQLRGTQVRLEMAKGNSWEKLVPTEVANYIKSNNLDQRFVKEFGLETLSNLANLNYNGSENFKQEKEHTLEN